MRNFIDHVLTQLCEHSYVQILKLLKAALTSQTALSSVFGPLITLKVSSVKDPLRSGLCQGNSEGSVEESPNRGNAAQRPCGSPADVAT